MIGLIDYDVLYTKKIRYPNLELMKMATYLRRKRVPYRMVIDLESVDFYTEIHLFQDDAKLPFPTKLLTMKQLMWHGLAFTDGVRMPLDPEIEKSEPTISVYKLLFKEYIIQDYIKVEQVSYLLNSSFVRLSEPVSKRYLRSVKSNRKIFAYDLDVFSGCWEKNTAALVDKGVLGFNFIHEQKLNDLETWLKMATDYPPAIFARNNIELTFELTLDTVETLCQATILMMEQTRYRFEKLIMRPTFADNHKNNITLLAKAIMTPPKYGVPFSWGETVFTGSPYHPILAALLRWASSPYFASMNFVDYCEMKRLYRERTYILKMVEYDRHKASLFLRSALDTTILHGGLREYDTRRNIPSIYETYL